MNSLAPTPLPPHFHQHRLSPTRSSMSIQGRTFTSQADVAASVSTQNPRKRKASPSPDRDDEMTTSPALANARLPQILTPASRKRVRTDVVGRPLTVDRLLETLDKDSLRSVLSSLVTRNPALKEEVLQLSPRPSIQSTLQVLRQYYDRMMAAFPLDPNPRSDYCYDRVRSHWQALLDALADFTPHFLPPNESQSSVSLEYLHAVTQIIHDLPEWDRPQYNLSKQNAYEEISRAWVSVLKEAGKRGGGMNLQYNGWEEKLRLHNEKSGGLLKDAYGELAGALGWLRTGYGGPQEQQNSIRQQLFSGTYGLEQPSIRTGMW
jgi:protein Cut8